MAFTLERLQPFTVDVLCADGNMVTVWDLQGDMNLATLINAVELELGVTGEDCVRLTMGRHTFQETDVTKLLRELDICQGVQLDAKVEVRDKGSCPSCRREIHVQRGVSLGIIRERCERKWTTFSCNCSHCGLLITPGITINCCMNCQCLWHKSCKGLSCLRSGGGVRNLLEVSD